MAGSRLLFVGMDGSLGSLRFGTETFMGTSIRNVGLMSVTSSVVNLERASVNNSLSIMDFFLDMTFSGF